MINQQNNSHPWYAKKKKAQLEVASSSQKTQKQTQQQGSKFVEFKKILFQIFPSILSLLFLISSFLSILFVVIHGGTISRNIILIISSIFLLFLSFVSILYQIGSICSYFSLKHIGESNISLGIKYVRGLVIREEPRKGIPAPEMALYQFVQQVRAYATEKSFLKQKQEKILTTYAHLNSDPNIIIKRRWNDVMDSLNEFEIYLANDPNGIIEKLIAKSPIQNMDVSQIFRDVAETFDTTWRRKGINIEQAIVTPLKANTNDALLRRLLVGPWRSCVYFAKRGNGVIFSAKSSQNKIIAHWECDGVAFPEEFYEIVRDGDISVNERIERGMEIVALDPNSPNMLFALISFITWLDLANAAGTDYSIKQGSEGLVIELRI